MENTTMGNNPRLLTGDYDTICEKIPAENVLNIRKRRLALGLSLEEVARRLNVSHTTVMRWENGDTCNISVQKLFALADILNTTPFYLLGLEGTAESTTPANANNRNEIAIKVDDDALLPRIKPGDTVIVNVKKAIKEGSFVAVRVSNKAVKIRKIKSTDNGLWLIPLNAAYSPIFYTIEDCETMPVQILGKAVRVIAEL